MINNILQNFLKKNNVKEFSELTPEEKETYRHWDDILRGRKLTDEDVKTFLDTELEETIQKVIKTKSDSREDLFLKMKLEFIRSIKMFLATPELEKKVLENNLKQD